MGEHVAVSELLTHPLGILLQWPVWDSYSARLKIEELSELGVEYIVFEGPHRVDTIPILGKGNTSIVLKAITRNGAYAAKIRRSDADRTDFGEEARLLKLANSVGVGPRLIGWRQRVLLMEFIEGPYLSQSIRQMTKGDAGTLRAIFRELVTQARRLDEVGLDHGELVRLRRHTIMRGFEPIIIDFESASTSRRVSNVTTILQSLFMNTQVSQIVEGILGLPDREVLLSALRDYRQEMSETNYEALIRVAGLEKNFTTSTLS